MTAKTLLIGDIGGTNARFALANTDQPGFDKEMILPCDDFPTIEQAIHYYLDEITANAPDKICLAIAGPIQNQQVQMTNNQWFISAQQLAHEFSAESVNLINDFHAIALSLPWLKTDQLMTIGPHLPPPMSNQSQYKLGVIGPGTGLGVAGLIKQAGHTTVITSEAGHMGFAAETAQQMQILDSLHQHWPRVSIERLLSGSGLQNIHLAQQQINLQLQQSLSAAEIFQQAVDNQQSLAYQSVQIFFEILGQVAGDIALAYGAEDGIYIAGGMVKRYPDLLRKSRFREAFESKGRHRALLQDIPTYLINHPQPGLFGAAVSFDLDQLKD